MSDLKKERKELFKAYKNKLYTHVTKGGVYKVKDLIYDPGRDVWTVCYVPMVFRHDFLSSIGPMTRLVEDKESVSFSRSTENFFLRMVPIEKRFIKREEKSGLINLTMRRYNKTYKLGSYTEF